MPRLPVPRLPPGGSLGTPKIFNTGATLHLGPIRLHVENWECRALQKIWCAVPIFLARVNEVYVVTPLFPYSEPVFSEFHMFFPSSTQTHVSPSFTLYSTFIELRPRFFTCQRGYTFVAEARTPNAILPPGKFRLRVIGSTEPLPYPGRDGVNSHFVNKEIRDYYIPNKYNIIFR